VRISSFSMLSRPHPLIEDELLLLQCLVVCRRLPKLMFKDEPLLVQRLCQLLLCLVVGKLLRHELLLCLCEGELIRRAQASWSIRARVNANSAYNRTSDFYDSTSQVPDSAAN
jgi:hypothetical protein